ncbi:MAG: BatD family protein [Flammeovirgaceae bacterium]|nr:BatD family protein [Flammeovirgaceae bacterium]
MKKNFSFVTMKQCQGFESISFFSVSFFFLLFSSFTALQAQKAQITLGPDEIGENQGWTITVTVQNDRLKSYDNFPEIEGFKKRGTSNQSTTNIVNGQISSSQSVVMTYMPTRQGLFTVPSFTMKVNDQSLKVTGKKVRVGAPVQAQQRDPFRSFFDRSPADDFFGRDNAEFVDIKEDAFLALTTDKDEVYVGEGFNAMLSFFVADDNRAPLQFYELGKQLSEILKKIKPSTCWEENFNIENIEGESITLGGKDYTQYKIYQANYYPLNTEPITFPSVGLEMIKFKVAKNPSFFGQNRQEAFKTFNSKEKKVKVKELPPHPLRDAVAVGNYKLDERISTPNAQTGQSVSYEFKIYGEGNISGIEKPVVFKDDKIELYEPNVRQDINREGNRVTGTKLFSYFLIPNEPGELLLGDYFNWVFFNPKTGTYDTLKSQLTLPVSGESKKNQAIESTDLGSFYNKISDADNEIRTRSDNSWQNWMFGSFIGLMLIASTYLVFKKQ